MFPIWYDDDEDVDRWVLAWCNVFGFGVSIGNPKHECLSCLHFDIAATDSCCKGLKGGLESIM